MISISKKRITEILSDKFAYSHVKNAAEIQSLSGTYVKARSTKSFGDKKLLADMAASIEDLNVFGLKHYVVNNDRFFYYIYLYDLSSKELLTIIEAEEIGKYRTAAVTALAVNKLRKLSMKNLAIIGTGFQAKQQLNSILLNNSMFDNIYIFSPNTENRNKFVMEFSQQYPNINFVNSENEKCALKESDVIVTATNSLSPVIHRQYLKENFLIIGIGAATPYCIEIDQNIIQDCDLVLVDDKEQAKLESGDILNPVSKGLLKWEEVFNFSDIFDTTFNLQENKNKIFFKSLGIALWDVAIAKGIYDLSK